MTTMLPENEYKWPTRQEGLLTDWELNAWLNYEYARSHRPMIEWVLKLRATKLPPRMVGELPLTRRNPLRFALFLCKHFPEFPHQPWLTIPQPERRIRLEQAGITEGTSLFEQSTVQEVDLDIYSYRTAVGDCDYDPTNLEDETYLLTKINFRRSDRQILGRLKQIIEHRRLHLKMLHASKVQHHLKKGLHERAVPLDPTRPDDIRDGVGQRSNPRVFYNRMQNLSALRLYIHFDRDMAKLQNASSLYAEEFSWIRAKDAALDTLARLRAAWSFSFFPPCVMEPFPRAQLAVPRKSRLRRELPRPEGKPMDQAEEEVQAEVVRIPGRLGKSASPRHP